MVTAIRIDPGAGHGKKPDLGTDPGFAPVGVVAPGCDMRSKHAHSQPPDRGLAPQFRLLPWRKEGAILSSMETNAPHPGQDDARDALEAAARSEAIARHPSLPGWYFPLMALVVAAVVAAQMLPSSQRIAPLGTAVVVILLVNRHVQTSTGIVWDSTRLHGQVPFLAAVLGVILATAVTVAITESEWVWAAGAAVAAGVALVAGVIYARKSPADD